MIARLRCRACGYTAVEDDDGVVYSGAPEGPPFCSRESDFHDWEPINEGERMERYDHSGCRVPVVYRVPVVALVRVGDDAGVERVVVEDESIALDTTSNTICPDCGNPLPDYDADRTRQARQVADSDVWPSWDFGW
jgi:ribosomal protein S27AE